VIPARPQGGCEPISEGCGDLSREQERSQAEQDNAERLREAIHALRTNHVSVLGHVNWRGFWDHSKQVTQMFRDAKPLRAETREQLWAEVSQLRDEMKHRQDNEYQARQTVSERRKAMVTERIEEAELTIRSAADVPYLRRADEELGEAMEMMKGGWRHLNDTLQEVISDMFLDDGKMLRDDNQYCWERWKSAKDNYDHRLQELRQRNLEQAQGLATEAWNAASVGDPYEALETIKAAQSELRGLSLPGDCAHLVWDRLNDAWAKATARIDRLNEEKQQRHEEWQRKQEEWRERMHDHITRWENEIDRGEEVIRRLEGQIDDLHDKLADAWSDDYISNIEGWIREKEDVIADIRRTNHERQEKIDDVRGKLNP
jgi:predicted phage tail protein